VIEIINFVLEMVIEMLSKIEKPRTATEYNISMAKRNGMA
jgi:hypothetical protein